MCSKCLRKKPPSQFHKDKSKSEGLRTTCIECVKQYGKSYRTENKERRERQTRHWRQDNPERAAEISRRSYKKNATKHKETVSAYRASNRKKAVAHGKVAYALRAGQLVPMRCEVCGSAKTEAHHDDYDRPLDVKWLCRKHHKAHHARHN